MTIYQFLVYVFVYASHIFVYEAGSKMWALYAIASSQLPNDDTAKQEEYIAKCLLLFKSKHLRGSLFHISPVGDSAMGGNCTKANNCQTSTWTLKQPRMVRVVVSRQQKQSEKGSITFPNKQGPSVLATSDRPVLHLFPSFRPSFLPPSPSQNLAPHETARKSHSISFLHPNLHHGACT